MKYAALAIAFIVPVAMAAACGSLNGPVPPTVHMDAGKALIAAEGTLDVSVLAADTAIKAGLTTPAQRAVIAALVPKVEANLTLARSAYAATDAATFPALTANLIALAAQLDAAH
ncbi:MAG: hypothetical protein M3T55_05845 [Pseudomonadota bacterium]|nr:hypothetical protein [Pseudomonadota bacterium]